MDHVPLDPPETFAQRFAIARELDKKQKQNDYGLSPDFETATSTATEAEIKEPEPSKEIAIAPKRHQLLVDVDKPYVKDFEKEIELDIKLNLKNQAKQTTESLLMKDIDELTSSNDYKEVNDIIIERMFSIPLLKRNVMYHNVKSATKAWFKSFWPACGILLGLVCFSTALIVGGVNQSWVVGVSGMIPSVCIFVISWIIDVHYNHKFRYDWITVLLKKNDVTDTEIKIPYGAKLKLLEAQESKIFDKFLITYPDVEIETRTKNPPKMEFTDPAIVGLTADKRMYLICWWDIEQDIDRVTNKIDWIKKYKV